MKPVFVIPDHVLTRQVDGQTVLVNLEDEQWFGLDPVGADVLEQVTTLPYQQAIDALCGAYDVDEERLRTEAQRLIDSLLRAGLLARVPADISER